MFRNSFAQDILTETRHSVINNQKRLFMDGKIFDAHGTLDVASHTIRLQQLSACGRLRVPPRAA